MTDFTLQAHLDYLYENKPRRLAFMAKTHTEFAERKQAFKSELVTL